MYLPNVGYNGYNNYNGYDVNNVLGFNRSNPNALPQQQVIQVNGKSSVDTIQLAPNSSVLVMDRSAPMVWLCISDGVGKVTAQAYDITPHKDNPPVDINGVEARLVAVEKMVEELKNNAKPNGKPVKSKPPITDGGAD